MSFKRKLTRLSNGMRKVSAGLRPFSESVWPGVKNDLFVAHLSLYRFFSEFTSHNRVLDAGCGTGYGADLLARCGAEFVLGVEIDRASVRYARRHYGSEAVSFVVGDCESLAIEDLDFDVVVASNTLEHLHEPERFLKTVRKTLVKDGVVIIVLPPILTTL